jgi:UDP-N-acetylmuramyl pentapeptide phosphotransferase/UDP-N-acetylglucosamine-1-phosphate transferase
VTLGFVLAVPAIRFATPGKQPVPMAFFLILYSSFLFDTSYTILRRAMKDEKALACPPDPPLRGSCRTAGAICR